jgi:DNA repair protein RadC
MVLARMRQLDESTMPTGDLAMIDVRILDHIVVAGARSTSFAERGLL